jgi:hypothetical protein
MTAPATFTGIQLSERFYWQAVRPLLDQHFPDLAHSAALIGDGSEVLGYDDDMSTDHHWGPRVLLFVRPNDYDRAGLAMRSLLAGQLPHRFEGFSTNFSPPDPLDHGVQTLQDLEDGPVNHRVEVQTPADFIRRQINYDLGQVLQPIDWLTFPEQKLLTITAGSLFHDMIGLAQIRSLFAYYPHDVWLYLLASTWTRIGQEEHLMGRAGFAGDELGSALIGARLVRDLMRLCFLMERTYAPYAKWFGTAFQRLRSGGELYPILQRALAAATWQEREQHLCVAYAYVARMHNRLNLTRPLPEHTCWFFSRPFQVIALQGYTEALCEQIGDVQLSVLARDRRIGSIDLFSDNVDLVVDSRLRSTLRKLYEVEA